MCWPYSPYVPLSMSAIRRLGRFSCDDARTQEERGSSVIRPDSSWLARMMPCAAPMHEPQRSLVDDPSDQTVRDLSRPHLTIACAPSSASWSYAFIGLRRCRRTPRPASPSRPELNNSSAPGNGTGAKVKEVSSPLKALVPEKAMPKVR